MPITGVPITNFSPASIAGLQLWLDAADATTQTFSNTSIISWRDKSSNAYNFNQIAGSPSNYTSQFPVIGTSINSLGTIYFNQGASLKQNTIIDGVKNLFWVGRIDNLPGIYFLFGADSSYDWHADSYPLKFVNAYAQSGILSASPTSLYTNGSSAITNTAFSNVYYPSTTNTSILSVAGISGSTRFQGICYDRSGVHIGWCGDLAEVITFSTALTTSQIQQVEGYLAQKWGQTNNLPSSHPSLTQKLFTKPLAPMTLTPYYTAFTPLSIPGCMVWLDATTLSGTSITSWPDRSGNGNNASGSGTLNATAMNGQKGVYNTSVNITGNLPLSQNFTFFFVFTVAGPGGYPRIFYTGPGADNGPGNFMFELNNNGNLLYGYSSGPSFGFGNYSVTYGKTMMLSMQANSSSNIVKINSGSYATASVTSPFTFSNYNFGYGYVGEMLYYNTTLSSSNIQNVDSYLASKWGLVSSLPSSHLHFTQPAGLPSAVPTSVKIITGFTPPGIKPTGLQIYSVYNGGARGGNYTIYYSDDNINFTAAFSGNVSSSACGIIAGSGTGDGSYGYHRYWKFTMTGATNSHFPRSSRIDLLAGNTVYNLITFASDNCSDTGKIPGLDYATTITNSYF
jgi:hypothetical protein